MIGIYEENCENFSWWRLSQTWRNNCKTLLWIRLTQSDRNTVHTIRTFLVNFISLPQRYKMALHNNILKSYFLVDN
jgi:hypothetical protein